MRTHLLSFSALLRTYETVSGVTAVWNTTDKIESQLVLLLAKQALLTKSNTHVSPHFLIPLHCQHQICMHIHNFPSTSRIVSLFFEAPYLYSQLLCSPSAGEPATTNRTKHVGRAAPRAPLHPASNKSSCTLTSSILHRPFCRSLLLLCTYIFHPPFHHPEAN